MTTNDETMPPKDALLQHQAEINTEQQRLETLQNAIVQQESTLAELQAALPDLAQLYRQREEMLADIAAGEADSAALVTLKDAISGAEAKKSEIEPAIATCQQTITGLQRKVVEQNSVLADLRKKSSQFIRRYLLALVDSLGADFLAKVEALLVPYKRLEGIGALLKELGHVPNLRAHGSEMKLPAYNAPVFDGKTEFLNKGLLYSGLPWKGVYKAARQEADRIRELDVDFAYPEEVSSHQAPTEQPQDENLHHSKQGDVRNKNVHDNYWLPIR